jgi:hypothetical protein
MIFRRPSFLLLFTFGEITQAEGIFAEKDLLREAPEHNQDKMTSYELRQGLINPFQLLSNNFEY